MPLTCDAIIFDLDGVLVDSNRIAERHLRGWTERHSIPFESVAAVHHGRTTLETIRLLAPHLNAELEAGVLEAAEAVDTAGCIVERLADISAVAADDALVISWHAVLLRLAADLALAFARPAQLKPGTLGGRHRCNEAGGN